MTRRTYLWALLLVASLLVPLGIGASPASAAGCGDIHTKEANAAYGFAPPTGDWSIRYRLKYRICDGYSQTVEYEIRYKRIYPSNCGNVSGWYANPNDIAGEFMSFKSFDCVNWEYAHTSTWPLDAKVWPSSTDRCISGPIVAETKEGSDGFFVIPNLCVPVPA